MKNDGLKKYLMTRRVNLIKHQNGIKKGLNKIAIVSDRCSYALQLSTAMSKISNTLCKFYGPKQPLQGVKKTVKFTGFINDTPVWTSNLYFFQIMTQAFRDKLDVIHFDYTVTIFGSNYLSSLSLPFLTTCNQAS